MAAVVAYRMTPRTLGYAIAAVAAFSVVAGAVGGFEKSTSIAGDALFVAIAVLGSAASLAIAACARAFEVRACDAGIMSISFNAARLIRWQDIKRFEIDSHRSSPFTVYAVLGDGSRLPLEPLHGGSSQEARVEQISDALDAALEQARGRRDDDAAWPRVPFGWRRRTLVVGLASH